jgi:Uncharacterized protein conserved in bacteria
MFWSCRRIPSCWITSLLLGLTLLFAVPVRAAQSHPKSCVWRVTNAKAPFYLVGSIHALSKKDYPLPAPYEIALKNSRRFLFEFDPNRHVEFEKKFEAPANILADRISAQRFTLTFWPGSDRIF